MADTTIPDVSTPATPAAVEMPHDGALVRNLRAMLMVWRRDIIRLFRMPTRIVTGIAQPLLFLFVLGAGLEGASCECYHRVREAYKTLLANRQRGE